MDRCGWESWSVQIINRMARSYEPFCSIRIGASFLLFLSKLRHLNLHRIYIMIKEIKTIHIESHHLFTWKNHVLTKKIKKAPTWSVDVLLAILVILSRMAQDALAFRYNLLNNLLNSFFSKIIIKVDAPQNCARTWTRSMWRTVV